MCQVKYVICPDINEQVNPGSKIWLPNVRSFLKSYCEHCLSCEVIGAGDGYKRRNKPPKLAGQGGLTSR